MEGPSLIVGRLKNDGTKNDLWGRPLGRPKNVTVLPNSKFEVRPSKFQNFMPKKITQNFFQNFFSTFSLASKHLRFYYIAQYSRYRSANFKSQCTNFRLEFFDEICIFGIILYNIYNQISILKQSDQYHSLFILALSLPIWGQ